MGTRTTPLQSFTSVLSFMMFAMPSGRGVEGIVVCDDVDSSYLECFYLGSLRYTYKFGRVFFMGEKEDYKDVMGMVIVDKIDPVPLFFKKMQ